MWPTARSLTDEREEIGEWKRGEGRGKGREEGVGRWREGERRSGERERGKGEEAGREEVNWRRKSDEE